METAMSITTASPSSASRCRSRRAGRRLRAGGRRRQPRPRFGQLPFVDGQLVTGRLGEDVSLEQGTRGARLRADDPRQLAAALGSLDRVERIVKLGAFVNSARRFTDQPKVANGASELMAEVFGEAGKHARSAVGVPVLPLGAAVEVDAIVASGPDPRRASAGCGASRTRIADCTGGRSRNSPAPFAQRSPRGSASNATVQ
jgi:enamine deaminase RidA (YjgF/YER057c/UK114 family)